MKNRYIPFIFLFTSFAGFLDAAFLTIEHYRGVIPPCSVIRGCEIVTASAYSMILGIPVALLGSLYYLTIFLLAVRYLESRNSRPLVYAAWLTPFGLAASAWFVDLQLMVLNSICVYCMVSAVTSTILFFAGMFVLRDPSRVK